MNSKNSSTKKSVNRARKANGNGNKSRSAPRNALPNRAGNGGMGIALGRPVKNNFGSEAPYIVRRKEFIQPIVSLTTGFDQIARLRVNPGSKITFPWLSSLAPLYEFYRFRRCVFELVTRSPTTASGTVIMSPDYDAADGELALTEQQIFANKGSVEAPVWERSMKLSLEPASMNRLYKSHTCMSDGRFALTKQDQKTIDAAQLFVCCEGAAAATSLGKLLVDYEVEFFNPQFPSESPTNGGAEAVANAGFNNANTTAPFAVGSNLGVTTTESVLKAVPITASTATVGQLIKDYTGFATNSMTGTGVGGLGNMYVGNNPGPIDVVNDILQPLVTTYTSGSTASQTTVNKVSALAGQYLKYGPPTNTTITSYASVLGGARLFGLIP